MKGTLLKINKTKSCFFEKINKMDKSLAKLIKNKKKRDASNQKLLHNKVNYKQGEKTALRLGENNSK